MNRQETGRNIFGFDGGFVNVFERIFDGFVLGLLWIVCSLPLITIGASTTALYYSMVKCVKHRDGYATREFFRSFRQNFVPATGLWLLFAGVTFVLQLNVGILMQKTSGLVGLFFICLYIVADLYVTLAACYAFPALSRFDMPVGWLVKVSLYMVVRYFVNTIGMALLLVCMVALVLRIPVLIFFIPGLIAYIAIDFMEPVLRKHEPKEIEGKESYIQA